MARQAHFTCFTRSFISVVQKRQLILLHFSDKAKQAFLKKTGIVTFLFVSYWEPCISSSYCHLQLLLISEQVLAILLRSLVRLPSLRSVSPSYYSWYQTACRHIVRMLTQTLLSDLNSFSCVTRLGGSSEGCQRYEQGRQRWTWAERRKNGALTGVGNLPHRGHDLRI